MKPVYINKEKRWFFSNNQVPTKILDVIQRNTETWSNQNNKINPETNPKVMQIYELHRNGLKIIITKMLNELNQNTDS